MQGEFEHVHVLQPIILFVGVWPVGQTFRTGLTR
jgi:hypothetical protein